MTTSAIRKNGPLSLFDLFKIGIGPSSSHTMGPMTAASRFVRHLAGTVELSRVDRISVDLFGSLALTGGGHGTHWALELGLTGETPETIDPNTVGEILGGKTRIRRLSLMGRREIQFDRRRDIVERGGEVLPPHPNGMRFFAFDRSRRELDRRDYFSIGGGFVLDEDEAGKPAATPQIRVPYPFASAAELLEIGIREGKSIAEIAFANEGAWRSDDDIRDGLCRIWRTMRDSTERGLSTDGILPGHLKVRRRAKAIYDELKNKPPTADDPLAILNRINVFALAVNEENAASGRIVTAPTNGAAGVVPAVLRYYECFSPGADEEGVFRFLLTAAAIAMLYKRNASISGAEMGCQGEVGVACSMAAAGFAAALNGTNAQIENAAEIGMEHNLGLTCDPVGGLVQVPCIERNAMAAVKAVNAAAVALNGDGRHLVSLDAVIETMRQTGLDMMAKYKETSAGGLAVNVVEC